MGEKVKDITDKIVDVLEYMNTDYIKNLRGHDIVLYEKTIEEKFPDFTERYYAVLKLLMSGEDITRLLQMLSQLEKVENNEKKREEAVNYVREELNNEYIYNAIKK